MTENILFNLEMFKNNILNKIKIMYNVEKKGFYGRDPSKKHSWANPKLQLTSILDKNGKLTHRLINPDKNENIVFTSNFYFNKPVDEKLKNFFMYHHTKKPFNKLRFGIPQKYSEEEINQTFELIEKFMFSIKKRIKYFQGESVKENDEIINLQTQLDNITKNNKNINKIIFNVSFNPNTKGISFKFPYREDLVNLFKSAGGFSYNPTDKSWNYFFNPEIMFYDINTLLTKVYDFSTLLGYFYKNNLSVYDNFVKEKLGSDNVFYSFNFSNSKDFFEFLDSLYNQIQLYKNNLPKFVKSILTDIFGLKKELYPFQLNSIAFHNLNKNAIYIGDEMGAGKTLQSISTLLAQGKLPILIISPAHLKESIANDIEKFFDDNLSAYVIKSGEKLWKPELMRKGTDWDNPFESLKEENRGYDILIINYDQLGKYLEDLKKVEWRGIIIDEAHYIKNDKAQRTQYTLEILKNLNPNATKILMSGTPITNSPADAITQLEGLGIFEYIAKSKYDFLNQYTIPKEIVNTKGNIIRLYKDGKNLEELNFKLRQLGYIRREKKDVIKELPNIIRIDKYLELPNRANYEKVEKEFIKYLIEKYGFERVDKLTDAQIEIIKQLHQGRFLLKESAMQKVEYLSDFYNQLFEENIDRKIIVFGYHEDVMNKIIKITENYLNKLNSEMKKSFKSIVLTADISTDKRQPLVNEFTNNPDAKIFITSLKVGSTGLNLQVADTVIFTELTFEPQLITQAEGRVSRIGQKANVVNSIFLIGENTFDKPLLDYILRKLQQMEKVASGEVKTKEWFNKNK